VIVFQLPCTSPDYSIPSFWEKSDYVFEVERLEVADIR